MDEEKEKSGLEKLQKLGERVRKAFDSKPEEKPASKSTQAAIDKAVGPRFQATPKKVEPIVEMTPAKIVPSKRPKKRTKKGPTKY